jgi:hypothetical protein
MNAWMPDSAIARLLSTNGVVLTGPPNSRMVGNVEIIQQGSTERDQTYCLPSTTK